MADISQALQAKSDQLNAMDIVGCEPVITIREVRYNPSAPSQKLWVFYNGDNGKPWKPSVGMGRILAGGWGTESDAWIGKSVKIFCEPSVKYAGKEVGGVHIRGMSHIPERGINLMLAINRGTRVPFHVEHLSMARPEYPHDRFENGFAAMSKALQDGKMTIEQIVAQCQKTGDLTQEQISRLQEVAPKPESDGEH